MLPYATGLDPSRIQQPANATGHATRMSLTIETWTTAAEDLVAEPSSQIWFPPDADAGHAGGVKPLMTTGPVSLEVFGLQYRKTARMKLTIGFHGGEYGPADYRVLSKDIGPRRIPLSTSTAPSEPQRHGYHPAPGPSVLLARILCPAEHGGSALCSADVKQPTAARGVPTDRYILIVALAASTAQLACMPNQTPQGQ